jgi:NADPH:quinone reductase-like Zn-dependent oxidoreductase
VHVRAFNPSDTYGRSGRTGPMAFPRVVPHQDGAGVIDGVGAGMPAGRVGKRVWLFEATWNRPHGHGRGVYARPRRPGGPAARGMSVARRAPGAG